MGNKGSKVQAKKRTGKLKPHERDPLERIDAVNDLLDTEETYVKGLRMIVETFQEPLIQSKKMKPKHIKTIFGNASLLLELHTSFLEALQDAATGTECREVGRVFVNAVCAPLLVTPLI